MACGDPGPAEPRSLPAIRFSQPVGAVLPTAARTPASTTGSQAERAAVTAVVRRYFRASNRLAHDMNPTRLQALIARSCPCQAQVESVRNARRAGEHFSGRATIHALRPSLVSPSSATVLADYAFSRGGLIDQAGERVTTIKAQSHIRWLFDLRRVGRRWVITRIGDAS